MSVSSSLSVPGSAVRKGNKKQRKDVSVSFKQVEVEEVEVVEEEEEEEESGREKENVKMNGHSEVKEEHDKEDLVETDISKDENEASIDNNTQL